MRRQLPPLNALKIFDIAGRTENFTKAADELCISQSAVSKQIRILEESLNTKLFSRSSGSVELTQSGSQILSTVIAALDSIESLAHEYSTEEQQEALSIDITPSLSVYWMFERINRFSDMYPDIDLSITSDIEEVDWTKTDIDLAIHLLPRRTNYPNAELLCIEKLVLIASPDLLSAKPVNSLNDISQHKLIFNSSRSKIWADFFKAFGLKRNTDKPQFDFQHAHMTVNAALRGCGLALGPKILCEKYIKTGELVHICQAEIDNGYGYYFLTPSYKRHQRKVRVFNQWIKSEFKDYQ